MPELKDAERQTTEFEEKRGWPVGAVWWLPAWALLFCAALVLYWPALHAGYFSDDFLFYFTSPPAHLYDYFFRVGAAIHAYRPLEAIILTVTQQHFRFETMPIHLSALACHAGLVCLVIAAARRFRLPIADTVIACAVLFFSQVGVPALLGNDTLSQSASAFLGWASVLLLWKGGNARILSVLCFGCSLFFKETAFGFLLAIAILAVYFAVQQANFKKAIVVLAPYGLMTMLYFVARHLAGGMLATHGRYGMHIGLNVIRNFASFGLAALSPVSTVTSAIALAGHYRGALLLCLLAAAVVVLATVAGVFVSKRGRLVCFLVILAVASLFPTFLLDHVSELYVYNAMPIVALIMGIAFGSLWRSNHLGRAIAVGCMALFLGGQVLAVRQKAELMTLNGRRAAAMIATINSYLPTLPPGSEVDLIRAATTKPAYSVFVLNGYDVLDFGNIRLGAVLGRPDVKINIVEEDQAQGLTPNDHLLLLGLDKNLAVDRYSAPSEPKDHGAYQQQAKSDPLR